MIQEDLLEVVSLEVTEMAKGSGRLAGRYQLSYRHRQLDKRISNFGDTTMKLRTPNTVQTNGMVSVEGDVGYFKPGYFT